MYERAALAYVKGLRRRADEGKPIDKIRSVNSVFVSRIDTAIDKLLQERIAKGDKLDHLLGKTGIAGLKLTYQKFKEIFYGDEFAALKSKGGAVQRPLWASTSTKNPHYPDLMYVESVVGRDTVNTMPPATLDALLDHGKIVPDTVESDLRGAAEVMRGLQDAKISLFEVTHQLQVEGVQLFSDSFAALLGAIVYKQKLLASGGAERVHLSLGKSEPAYDAALEKLASADFLKRMWAHDATLWSTQPEAVAIIKKSLGWLDIQQHMLEEVAGLKSFAQETKEGFDSAVVCGMGGSSLAPDIIADTFGPTGGYPRLHVLDSTSPQQIKELEEQIEIPASLFIISSKSGTTTEPNAFYAYFHEKVSKHVGAAVAGRNFVAITDPGTTLDKEAKGRIVPRRFRERSEHRRQILGALLCRHRTVRNRRLRHQLAARSRARRDARQRSHRRPTQRPGRAFWRSDRRACGQRARQAHDRHACGRQGVRRLGRTADRRIDRQARKGHRANRRRGARRTRRLLRRSNASFTLARTCPTQKRASTRNFARSRQPAIP